MLKNYFSFDFDVKILLLYCILIINRQVYKFNTRMINNKLFLELHSTDFILKTFHFPKIQTDLSTLYEKRVEGNENILSSFFKLQVQN